MRKRVFFSSPTARENGKIVWQVHRHGQVGSKSARSAEIYLAICVFNPSHIELAVYNRHGKPAHV